MLVDLRRGERHDAKTLEVVVHPGVPIPAAATRVHGIRDTDVSDLGNFVEIAEQLTHFIADRPLVGFNVSFDKRILNAELKRHGFKSFQRKRGCCVQRALHEAWGYRPSLRNAMEGCRSGGLPTRFTIHSTTLSPRRPWLAYSNRTRSSTVEQAPGDRWSGMEDLPPTRKQLDYISDLGGNPSRVKTRRHASEAIDRLKSGQSQVGGCLGAAAIIVLLTLLVGTVAFL